MDLELVRDFQSGACTLGVLTVMGRRWHSLERPWVPSDNGGISGKKGVSCVAPGIYKLNRHSSEAFPNVWALTNPMLDVYHWEANVPKDRRGKARTTVLIHPANYVSELRGCIALGKERKKLNGAWCVLRSRDAINELRSIVGGTLTLNLIIRETFHNDNPVLSTVPG